MAELNNLIVNGKATFLGKIEMDKAIGHAVTTINCSTATGWQNTYYTDINVASLFGRSIESVYTVTNYQGRSIVNFSITNGNPDAYSICVFWYGGNGSIKIQIIAKYAS